MMTDIDHFLRGYRYGQIVALNHIDDFLNFVSSQLENGDVVRVVADEIAYCRKGLFEQMEKEADQDA